MNKEKSQKEQPLGNELGKFGSILALCSQALAVISPILILLSISDSLKAIILVFTVFFVVFISLKSIPLFNLSRFNSLIKITSTFKNFLLIILVFLVVVFNGNWKQFFLIKEEINISREKVKESIIDSLNFNTNNGELNLLRMIDSSQTDLFFVSTRFSFKGNELNRYSLLKAIERGVNFKVLVYDFNLADSVRYKSDLGISELELYIQNQSLIGGLQWLKNRLKQNFHSNPRQGQILVKKYSETPKFRAFFFDFNDVKRRYSVVSPYLYNRNYYSNPYFLFRSKVNGLDSAYYESSLLLWNNSTLVDSLSYMP